MKKIILLLFTCFLVGCSNLDTINNKLDEIKINSMVKDTTVPQFRLKSIKFAPYSAELSKTYYNDLIIFASSFNKNSVYNDEHKILIKGYIDSDENSKKFNNLGRQRAEMVKEYLINKNIPEEKIFIQNLSGKEYLESNNNVIGKAKNRSVVTEIVK